MLSFMPVDGWKRHTPLPPMVHLSAVHLRITEKLLYPLPKWLVWQGKGDQAEQVTFSLLLLIVAPLVRLGAAWYEIHAS